MTKEELRKAWEQEESVAHIHGWDFSHIRDRYEEEEDLPWDYDTIVRSYLNPQLRLLDYDTGGGEYLLSLAHPYAMTAATEGFPPNIDLCKKTLLPLGIDFRPCDNPKAVPYDNSAFDIYINRHGDFDPAEIKRVLKPNGIFITQQVGGDNDRDLVERVLPDVPKPFPHNNLREQRLAFEEAGFEILNAQEAFRPIRFYDIGAFVWFAHIIEWEFPGFSVDKCYDSLLNMQREIESNGKIEGTIHRYLLVARKK